MSASPLLSKNFDLLIDQTASQVTRTASIAINSKFSCLSNFEQMAMRVTDKILYLSNYGFIMQKTCNCRPCLVTCAEWAGIILLLGFDEDMCKTTFIFCSQVKTFDYKLLVWRISNQSIIACFQVQKQVHIRDETDRRDRKLLTRKLYQCVEHSAKQRQCIQVIACKNLKLNHPVNRKSI